MNTLLDINSIWVRASVDARDIEFEREALEAKYRRKIAVHEVSHPVRYGTECTQVEWAFVD